jgi:alpha-L-fucosidase 2
LHRNMNPFPALPVPRRAVVLAVLALVLAGATHAGARFDNGAPIYEADLTPANVTDNISVELRVRPDADCPEGAVIVDRIGPGTFQGIRLEMGAGRRLRLLTSTRKPIQAEAALPADRQTHVVATFNPREKNVAIYLDGKLAASMPVDPKMRIDANAVQAPLRIGADLAGQHRFKGEISHVAVYDRALKEDDVARLAEAPGQVPGLAAAWELAPDSGRRIAPSSGRQPLFVPSTIEADTSRPANALTLWYRQPAREWLEALPFGNGRLGGTVFGGVDHERIQLNENTIWSGAPYDPANPDAPAALPEIRSLLFAGKQKEAEELTLKSAMGKPLRMSNYQTLGSLALQFPDDGGKVTHYRRSLDIDSAIATTRYTRGGVTYTREVFASHPDQAVVVRLTADKPNSISLRAGMYTPFPDARVEVRDGLLALSGNGSPFNNQPGAVKFKSLVKVQSEGGSVAADGDALVVNKASAVTLIVAAGTNFVNYKDVSGDADARARQDLERAASQPYAQLRQRHVRDYQSLFHRVSRGQRRRRTAAHRPAHPRLRRQRPGHGQPVLPVRALPLDLVVAPGFATGQPAGLVERCLERGLGRQVHHQHQHRGKLLAGRDDQPGRVRGAAVRAGARHCRHRPAHRSGNVQGQGLGHPPQHRPLARHRADRCGGRHVAGGRRLAEHPPVGALPVLGRPPVPGVDLSDPERGIAILHRYPGRGTWPQVAGHHALDVAGARRPDGRPDDGHVDPARPVRADRQGRGDPRARCGLPQDRAGDPRAPCPVPGRKIRSAAGMAAGPRPRA